MTAGYYKFLLRTNLFVLNLPLKKTPLDCGDDKYPDDPESRFSSSSHCLQHKGLASGPRGVRLISSMDEFSGMAPPW